MLHAVPNIGRSLLTSAARTVGLRALREDPCAFVDLLEQTIRDHERWFTPNGAPDTLPSEEARLYAARLEDLVDEAVSLALELYPKRRRDIVLLSIAAHTERLMRRIWSDPLASSARMIAQLARPHGSAKRDRHRQLELLKTSRDDTDS
jgi:hypothetical protein